MPKAIANAPADMPGVCLVPGWTRLTHNATGRARLVRRILDVGAWAETCSGDRRKPDTALHARTQTLWSYSVNAIHGLLQTEPYMRALLAARCPILEDDEINARVEARLARQELPTRKPKATASSSTKPTA